MRYLLLIFVLGLSGCTLGEALGFGAATGLGGYLLGEHMNKNDHPSRYYHCERGEHYDRCY